MANPLFEKLKGQSVQNNPFMNMLGQLKQFKQNFSQGTNPMNVAQMFIKNNNIQPNQANNIKQQAKQLYDAGYVTKEQLDMFNKMF